MDIEERLAAAQSQHRAGQFAAAEKIYREILVVRPDQAAALHLLGLVCYQTRRDAEAYELMKRSLDLDPTNASWLANFGAVCRSLGHFDEARQAYQNSLQFAPDVAVTWNNLGNVYADMEEFESAIKCFRKTLTLDPGHPNTEINLAKTYADAGDWASAFTEFRKGLDRQPNAREHSTFLLYLHYADGPSVQEIFEEHVRFGERYADGIRRLELPDDFDFREDRPLRIGYVSPDFRQHAVAQLAWPLLANHDHAKFIIHCYFDGSADAVTDQFRGCADEWRDTRSLSHEQLAELIQKDRIDILVDLAGHTGGNRMMVFARKPAPVQITHLGYPNTTGVRAIDYRFTDALRDPVSATDHLYTEKLYRLRQTAWCYDPPGDQFTESPLPVSSNGYITFGCFNNLRKITPSMIAIWSRILKTIPHSRLILITGLRESAPSSGRNRLVGLFAAENIPQSRLELAGRCTREEYFRLIQRTDIALDTFPYQGGVTTLNTLWAGVPVVVLTGNGYVSRVGTTLLRQLELTQLIASTPAQYIEIATSLAADIPGLTDLRQTLHDRFMKSPLADGPGYAREVENAFREIWKTFCRTQKRGL